MTQHICGQGRLHGIPENLVGQLVSDDLKPRAACFEGLASFGDR